MKVDLDEFLRAIRPEVAGCPEDVILNAVREALRDLCFFSGVWREQLPDLDLYAGLADYDLDAPYESEVVRIVRAKQGDTPLAARREADMDRLPDWRDATGDTLESYCLLSPAIIRFYPKPETDGAGPVQLWATLQPTRHATQVDDFLLRYEPVIADGALGRLLMMRARPWSDPQMAVMRRREFERGKSAARIQVESGHTTEPLTARPRPFAM